MHRSALGPVVLLSVLALVGACQPPEATERSAPREAAPTVAGVQAVPGEFSFAAAGDIGANKATAASLRKLVRSDARFFLALGDMDYDQTKSDAGFCRYVKDRLPTQGRKFPFELLVGNHEADGGPDGRIRRHARCLPDRLDSSGKYARQYAFSFPRADPLARFILIAPRLRVDGHTYRYGPGTADRKWLVRKIDNAQAAGQWVVVGMHYPCLSIGSGHPGCASGHAVHNLLLGKGVDVILVGHNHVYERGKQLALSGDCPSIPPGEYDADCVADSGEDGSYAAGAGTVQVTSGRFGGRPMTLDHQDPDEPYFAATDAGTTGFAAFTVTADRLAARYVASTGTFRDSFVIERTG
ncbi:MAG: metallophosphoesterase [Nocardioides sp.]